jgi:PTS system mannose-specific IIA component
VNHLLIIAHAPLASALRGFSLHAYPELAAQISAYDVPASETREISTQHALALLPTAADVLVCADVFGASPFFVAQAVAAQRQAKLLVGANAPMLMRACCYRELPLADWAAKALEGGQRGVLAVEPS